MRLLRAHRRFISIWLIALMASWQIGQPLQAATFYWDGDGNPVGNNTNGTGLGGSGTWDTSTLNWWNTATNVAWPNSLADAAIFNGAAGSITLGAGINAGSLIFNTNGYSLNGGTLTLGDVAKIQVQGSNGSMGVHATIGSVIAGTSGLSKEGSGALVLTNNANTYTGATAVKNGTLSISSMGQLGASTGTVSVFGHTTFAWASGTLQVQGGSVAGPGLTFDRDLSLAGRGSNTIGTALHSIGNNTFTGDIATSSAVETRIVAAGGTTILNGNLYLGVADVGQVIYGNGNVVINGQIIGGSSGQIHLVKANSGIVSTLTLTNNNNSFLGATRADSGTTIRVSHGDQLGRSTSLSIGAITFNSGTYEFRTDAPGSFATKNISYSSNSGTIFVDRAIGSPLSLVGQTVDFGNLRQENSRTFTFTGRNGFGVTIASLSNSSSGNAGETWANSGNGLLTINGSVIWGEADTTARTLTINANSEIIMNPSITATGPAHAVSKGGTGTLVLNGNAATYTGATTVSSGTLALGDVGAVATTSQINLGNATTTSGALSYLGGTATLDRNILLNTTTANAYINANGTGALTLTGSILTSINGIKTLVLGGSNTADNTLASVFANSTGAHSLQKIGAGTWVLTAANTYTGLTTVSGGTLKVSDTFSGTSRNVIADASGLTFGVDAFTNAAGGIFEYLGDGTNASTESLGALTPAAGAGTVKVTAGAGGTAALTFSSLANAAAGSGLNFVTNTGASVILTGATDTNGILNAHVYYNGADFASGSTVGAATYIPETTGASLLGGNILPYQVSADITAQLSATINAGIKFSDTRSLTLDTGATLTLQNGAGTVAGGILVTGGSTATLSGGTGITSGGAADLVFRTNASGDTLILNTPILSSSTGGWTKLGAGTLVLGAANANTTAGAVNINEGTVRLTAGATLGADGTDVNLRQGATLNLNGVNLGTALSTVGSLDVLNGAGIITNTAAATTASLNVGSAGSAGFFTGSIQDGAGKVALVKSGAGIFRLTGAQNYSGGVTINGGTLTVNNLANFGSASGLGTGITGNNAGSLVFSNGTLNYTGADGTIQQSTGTLSVSIDRQFTLAGNGTITSNGSYGNNAQQARVANHATLVFNSPADVSFSGAGARLLTLGGDSLGDNEIKLGLRNNGADALAITKTEAGLWILSNPNNDYSGATTINAGVLRIESSAYSTFTNTVLGGGILETSGSFTRAIGTGANQIQWTGTSNSGFAASIAPLTVNLGNGTPLVWGSTTGFSSTGQLLLNSTTALADVNFANDINLNGAARVVNVADNTSTGTDFAIMSGTLSGTGSSGLTKTGNGLLYLSGANTYNGNTAIQGGQVAVTSIGSGGASSNFGNATGTLTLGNTTTGVSYLMYYGTGETVTRSIIWNSTTGATTLDSSGSGPLVINNFSSTGNGAKTLTLRGFNSDANLISSNIGNATGNVTTVTKTDGGTWILTGNNTFTGNLSVSSGWLGLGSGASAGATATGILVLGNGGIFAAGGTDLSISRAVQLTGNASSLYTGDHSITFTGTVTGTAANSGQAWNIYNTLSPGATLTFNAFTSSEDGANDVRPLVIAGTGATVFTATIANHAAASSGTGGTSLTMSAGNNATLTLAGSSPNTYSAGTNLSQGTLILAKVGALGTGSFTFNGGVLQTTMDLAGADKLTNNVVFASSPGVVVGNNNLEFGGTVTNSGGDRVLVNRLNGATLSITGGVNLSNDATSRTFTIAGEGNTLISGIIANGSTAPASALRMRGTGTLTLTAANEYDGATSVFNGILELSGAGTLDQNSEVTVTGLGTLRLDNSGTNLGNRVSDTKDFNLDGGLLDFIGNGVSSAETFFRLDINGNGNARINMSTGGTNTLTFGSVNFATTGSVLDLSSIVGLGGANKILFTTAPAAAFVSNGILPRIVLGSNFAEYNATNGVQAFTGYNTSNNLVTALATDTMSLTASANIALSRTLNALKLSTGGITVGSSVAGSQLTLTSGAVLVDGGTNTLNVPLLNTGANGGFFQVTAGSTLEIDSTMIGTSYTQLQGGAVSFNSKQFYTTQTNIHGGTLKLNAGLNAIMPLKANVFISPGATLDLNGNTQFIGNLSGSSDQPGGSGSVISSTGTGTLVSDNGGNWMGTIDGGINFGRVGGNTLTIGTPQTYTGWTFITGGTLTTLRDNGALTATSGIDINLTSLFLGNNDNLQIQNDNRINDAASINLRGGTISITGRALTDAVETLGPLSALMGANTLTATAGGGGAFNSATLTMASLTRSSGATINFTGTTLGQTGNSGFIKFSTTPTTVGNNLLGAWAIANSSDYAAYVHGVGVGAVGSGGFTPYSTQEVISTFEAPNPGVFAPGAITNLMAFANVSVQLGAGTTTTDLLRFGGAFTNDLLFTGNGDILNLQLGGILRSNNNNLTTIGTPAARGIITSGTNELVVYNGAGTLTIHSVIQGATSLVKSGAGTLTLTATNDYSISTVVNQGILRLEGDVGVVVIPNTPGGVTLTGATLTMVTNGGQIGSGNSVTLNGSSTLTLVANNTLDSIIFNHVGGTGAPAVATGGILTLTNPNAVTVTSNNAIGLPTIGGFLELGSGVKTFNIGAHQMNGVVYDNSVNPSLSITAVVTGTGASILKTGDGLLLLSGANTFNGGMTVSGGGIVIGNNSTSTFANSLVSGPLGTGPVSMAAGTKVAVNDSSRVVANAFSFASNPIFSNTGSTTDTLTLNGALTFSTLGSTGLVANIDTPYLNVVLGGDIQGIGSVTAIGSTGPNTISKTGPGNLSGLNLTGIGATVPINLTNLTNTSFTLLHDGDGTSGFETINLGVVTWESVNGALNLTIGRAGSGLYFPTAAYKTIALASLNSSNLPSGLLLTNSNGYGLIVPDDVTLAAGNLWSVLTANTSLQVTGLTLSGVISGTTNFSKTGDGVLKLTNASNSFTGTIDVVNGTIEGASDAVFGNPANIIQIGSNSLTEGLRVSGSFATSRTIHLNAASSGIDVTRGNTLTLNSPFTFATATNALAKNDLGTLILTQAQPGWDGVFTINQGILRLTNATALGTSVGGIVFGNVAASLELSGGLTIAEPLTFASGDDVTSNGLNGSGAVHSISGDNVLTGAISLNAAGATDDRSRAATFTVDSGATLDIRGVVTGTVGAGQNRDSWIGLGGSGNGTLSTAMALTGTLGTNRYFSINKFGSGTWTITAANAHPGTRVVIKEGTLAISGAGSLGIPTAGQETVPTVYLNPSGTLSLDSATTDVDNRLSGRALNLSGADVNIIGNAAGTTETIGALTLREGLSTITLDANAAGQLNFTTGALTRSAGATMLVRGDNLGTAAGAGVATMTGSAYPFIGQVGSTGTATKAIIPWAIGDTSLTGSGTGFLTANSTGGADTGTNILRFLLPSEQTTNFATANANVNLGTLETLTLSSLTTVNSLRLASGGGVALNYVPLNLDSGGLISLTGNVGITGFSGVSYLTTSANRELILHTVGDLTLGVPVAATTGALVKSGPGTLTLTEGNSNHGTVVINDGTLKLGGGDQTILPGRNLVLNYGGTLDLNGTVQQFNVLESRLTAVLAQADLFPADSGGIVNNSSATQATLVVGTGNVTFSGSIQGNVALVRSQAAAAFQDWNLYSEQTYTGPTLFNGGRSQLIVEGRISNSSSIEVANATFIIGGSNATTDAQNITDRIGDTIPITLRGGSLQMNASAGYYYTETIGAVTLAGGQNLISMGEGGTRVNQWDVTMASLTNTPGSHSTIRFYGIDSDPNDNARLFITAAPVLSQNLIGGWAVFEREFASYTTGQGVGALNTQGYAGYSPNLINDGISTDNIRIALPATGSTTVLTGSRALNSLNIQGAASATGNSTVDLGGNTLTLVSGGLITSGATDNTFISLINGNLTAGTLNVGGDLYLHTFGYINGNTDVVNRDVNIDVNLIDNGTGPVSVVFNAGDGRGTGLDGLLGAESTNVTGNNSYTGGTWINGGRVVLNNPNANGTTITATGTGDITISGGPNTLGNTYQEYRSSLFLGASDQIANTATIYFVGSGRLSLNNFNQTVAALNFNNTGGHNPEVATGTGTLTVTGNITASGQNASSNATSTINGKLQLGAGTTTITVHPVEWNGTILNPYMPNLLINASIEGNSIVKAGEGILRLAGSNAYTGSFDLQAGGLSLASNTALSTGLLTIGDNTFLTSTADTRIIANPYTVNGDFALRDAFNLTLSGPAAFAAGSHDISVQLTQKILTLSGVISGATASINKTGDGILVLGNSNNTYGGTTTVTDGVLRYGVINAIPVGSAVTVLEGSMLDITLGGTSVTLGSLASNNASQGGAVYHGATTGTNTLTVGADNSTTSFGGVISNAAGSTLGLVKTGSGTFTVGGPNTYNGPTTVQNGRLIARPVAGGSALGTSQSVIMGGTTTSGILQLGDGSGPLNLTLTSLSSQGTGTASQIVSGSSTMATLTLNLATTSTFRGNIGGAGINEANLNLVKSGAGDLTISGTGVSTYTGTTTVSGGKLFMDTPGAFSNATTSLTLADGTEFSLRGTTNLANQVYGFTGTGNKITVGTTTGATLGFGIDGSFNTRLNLAAGQTMTVNGTLTTAIYVNSAPISGQAYVLINGTDASSLHAGAGTFNVNPVIFNGGSFSYALTFGSGVNGGGLDQWILTPTAVAAAADTWWKGDLTGLGLGVWSATTTSGAGFPSNWDTTQTGGIDAVVPPDSGSIVHFSATGAANFATTLGASLTIQELIFHTGNVATSIGSSNGTNTLTLGNGTDPSGLTIQAGAANVSISAIVALAQSQAWNINDTARLLTLSGGLTGTGVTLTVNAAATNAGSLLFSDSAATMTGTLAMNAGTLSFEDTGSLNSGLNVVLGTATTPATLKVGGTTAATSATIGGLSNGAAAGSKVVGGNAALSTLAIGPASGTSTFTGALGGAGTNENQFNLEKTGAGIQILNGSITYAGTTVVRDGRLQLGTSSTFTAGGALSVLANAGATAIFDFNGRSYTGFGNLTLGGGLGGIAQVLDSNATKGVYTLGGNIIYDATNNPGSATISTNINTGGANRIITVGDSTGSTTELTISGTITAITDNNLTINGAGSGTLSGNISLNLGSGTGATNDMIFASTGTWNLNAKIEVDDDIVINSGIINANAVESLDALDDVVITGNGTQGSTVVNINVGSQVHTGDDFYIRGGAVVNVYTTNGINTGTDQLLIGDSGSASAAAAGLLNLVSANIAPNNGIVLGGASGNIGNITGTGIITSANTKFLRNGSIEPGITLAGNGAITKDTVGTVTFYGDRATASTGATNLQEGSLILDYSLNNNSKIGGVLTLGIFANVASPTLTLNGSSSAPTTQSVASTIIAAGNTTIAINNGAGQTATLNLGAITRAITTTTGGGVVTFQYSSTDAVATSTSPAGTLGWATLSIAGGVERFAAIDGTGNIVQAILTTQNDVTQWAAGQNIITNGALTGVVDNTHITSLTFGASVTTNLALTSTGHLLLSSGGLMVDSDIGAFNTSITGGKIYGATSGILGELIIHQNNTLGTLTIASQIVNSGGITKTGLGTVILSGANTYVTGTGSQVTVNEGILRLAGGNAIGDTTNVYIRQGATLDLANSNEVIGHLVTNSSGTIALGTGDITFNQTAGVTYAGVFTGIAGSVITINSAGFNFNLTASTTTGFIGTVVVNSGLLQLSGATARLNGATSFTFNKGANILIDNNDDNAPNDRISETAAFVLNSADGNFSGETRPRGIAIRSDNNANESEGIGALTLNSGASYASLESSGGTSAQVNLTAANWTRSNSSTLNVRGRTLGGASANSSTQFKILDGANEVAFLASTNLVGGGAVTGASHTNISIVPWAIGENLTAALADTNMGNTLLTYVDNRGFVPLDLATEYATYAAAGAQDNVRESFTADVTGLAGKTINALVLNNNSTAASTLNVNGAGAGASLTNTSGAFLFTLNSAATASTAHKVTVSGFDGGIKVGASNEYVMFVVNPSSAVTTPTLTTVISSPLNSTTASLTKSGRGTLELTAVNTYTGGTTVNEGTLIIHDTDNIGTTGNLALAGGTLTFASDFTDDIGGRNLVMQPGGGTIDIQSATLTATNLVTSGTGPLTKTGAGTLQITGATANTQTGDFTVNRGLVELNKPAAVNAISSANLLIGFNSTGAQSATVRLLAANQIANTTNVSLRSATTDSIARLDLNGFAETIGSLTMGAATGSGVFVTTGATGVLTLGGDIVLNSDRSGNDNGTNARNILITGTGTVAAPAPNSGTLSLGAATRTITVQTSIVGAAAGNNDATIETAITGTGNAGIIKEGSRALVLSGTNTYTGATTVNNGELNLRGTLSTGAVTVSKVGGTLANAAVLSGGGNGTTTGIIGGSVTIGEINGDVGILSPGSIASTTTLIPNYGANANGTMTFTAGGAALTVADGSQIQLGITSATYTSTGVNSALESSSYVNAVTYIGANTAEFTSNWNIAPGSPGNLDFLNLTGANSSLSIGNRASATFGDGSVRISIVGAASLTSGQVFNLIDWQGLTSINGNFDTGGSTFYSGTNITAGDLDLPSLSAGLSWDVSAFSQYGILVIVPEPSKTLFLLLGLLGLMLRRRR